MMEQKMCLRGIVVLSGRKGSLGKKKRIELHSNLFFIVPKVKLYHKYGYFILWKDLEKHDVSPLRGWIKGLNHKWPPSRMGLMRRVTASLGLFKWQKQTCRKSRLPSRTSRRGCFLMSHTASLLFPRLIINWPLKLLCQHVRKTSLKSTEVPD